MNWDEYRAVTKVIDKLGYEMEPLNWDDPIAMFEGCKDHDMVRDMSVDDTIIKINKDLEKYRAIKDLLRE